MTEFIKAGDHWINLELVTDAYNMADIGVKLSLTTGEEIELYGDRAAAVTERLDLLAAIESRITDLCADDYGVGPQSWDRDAIGEVLTALRLALWASMCEGQRGLTADEVTTWHDRLVGVLPKALTEVTP